jgi:hypothetical protein
MDDYVLRDEIGFVQMVNDAAILMSHESAEEIRKAIHLGQPFIEIFDLSDQRHTIVTRHVASIMLSTSESRIQEAHLVKALRDETKYIDPDNE